MKQTCGMCENFIIYDDVFFGGCDIEIPVIADKVNITPDFNADGCSFFERKAVTCADCENFDVSGCGLGVCGISLPVCITEATISMLSTQNATDCTYFMEK